MRIICHHSLPHSARRVSVVLVVNMKQFSTHPATRIAISNFSRKMRRTYPIWGDCFAGRRAFSRKAWKPDHCEAACNWSRYVQNEWATQGGKHGDSTSWPMSPSTTFRNVKEGGFIRNNVVALADHSARLACTHLVVDSGRSHLVRRVAGHTRRRMASDLTIIVSPSTRLLDPTGSSDFPEASPNLMASAIRLPLAQIFRFVINLANCPIMSPRGPCSRDRYT